MLRAISNNCRSVGARSSGLDVRWPRRRREARNNRKGLNKSRAAAELGSSVCVHLDARVCSYVKVTYATHTKASVLRIKPTSNSALGYGPFVKRRDFVDGFI
jgi:hypothetical protein